MVSAIVTTVPPVGVPVQKAPFHTNWTAAKNEIEALQAVQVFDVSASFSLAATHNGAVIRCTAAITITWPNLGNFGCTVLATTGAVVINGLGATNATIPDECAGTLLQTTGTQNVFVSAPRVVVS